MPDTATPTVDQLRAAGRWEPSLDDVYELDPGWTEAAVRMVDDPWRTGILPIKWIELICIALNANTTHRDEIAVERHVRAALDAGASAEEILDTFKGVCVLGIHSVAVALPILFEQAAEAGVAPASDAADDVATPMIDRMRAVGQFNPAWEAIYKLDPMWLEEFIAMGADLYRGVLEPKLVELMALAVDASCTHLYAPGIRRHIKGAFAEGATIGEIMEVLKLCGGMAVDACELGGPILAQELASRAGT
jgi:alkylhydroperoxidase/carboxymuconolactone decarboxylase family protein YurZ